MTEDKSACGGLRGTSSDSLNVVSKYVSLVFLVPLARRGAFLSPSI